MADHYAVFNIASSPTPDEIRRAYRALALQNHPDKTILLSVDERTAREAHFKQVSGAYEVLSDASLRAAYDAKLSRTHPRSRAPGSYYTPSWDNNAQRRRDDWTEARREKRARQEEQRRERKRQREAAEAHTRQENYIAPEDIQYASQPHLMGPTVWRTFGPWTYEIRLSTLFKLRDNTEPAESSADLARELHIAVKLDAVPQTPQTPDTEDLFIRIVGAPGAPTRFETHLKERCDGSCILNIVLFADPSAIAAHLPLELPIDLRLSTNWLPFGAYTDAAVRATYLRFFADGVKVPDEVGDFGDEELKGAERVDIGGQGRRWVRSQLRRWKRVASVEWIGKWWSDGEI